MNDTDLIERQNQMMDWPDWLRQELERNMFDGRVGQSLVSETDRVRVWLIRLRPGERLPLHRHVLDYFWTATTAGAARSHVFGGKTVERVYAEGETQHQHFGRGKFKIHDLENIGDGDLAFTTVEFLDGDNAPLAVAASAKPA